MPLYRVWYSWSTGKEWYNVDVDAVDLIANTAADAKAMADLAIKQKHPGMDLEIDGVYLIKSAKTVYKTDIV